MVATIRDEQMLALVALPQAVNQFLKHCREVSRLAPTTVGAYKSALGRLVEICEPGMMTHQLNPGHIQLALTRGRRGETDAQFARRLVKNPRAVRQTPRSDGSMNIDNSAYRMFEAWAKAMSYLSPNRSATYKVKNAKKNVLESERRERRWELPHDQRNNLLDMAGRRHARDRFVIAMGLYGGRRWSDYRDMRISDVDLEAGTFSFTNKKAGGVRVDLPYIIFPEFENEVNRWMAYLAGEFAELDPDWYLIPSRVDKAGYSRQTSTAARMNPDWPVQALRMVSKDAIDTDVKYAFEVIGAPLERYGIGTHTLRRSCADWLRDVQGWRHEHIQIWLQHADANTTSIYLSKKGDGDRLLDLYGRGPVADEDRELLSPGRQHAFRRHLELLSYDEDDVA